MPLSTSTKRLASAVPETVLSALTVLTVPSTPPTAPMVTVGGAVSITKVPSGLTAALRAVRGLPAASVRVPAKPVTVRSAELLWPLATV